MKTSGAFSKKSVSPPEAVRMPEAVGEPLPKGGSGRVFSRIRLDGDGGDGGGDDGAGGGGAGDGGGVRTAILCRYDDTRAENALYAGIADFLSSAGFPVPAVLAHDAATRRLLLEDLGSVDILTLSAAPWHERRAAYRAALDALRFLQQNVTRRFFALPPAERPCLMPGFDAALYRWEQDYFRRHCFQRLAANHSGIPDFSTCEDELAGLVARLLAHPAALVHRDCQSENILWRGGQVCFIDFQGMRTGSAWYDIASLLEDPYARLDDEQRSELYDYHTSFLPASERATARQCYSDAAAQRLMQALGAYGFLGIEKQRPAFLRHTRPALAALCRITAANPHLPTLHRLASALLPLAD